MTNDPIRDLELRPTAMAVGGDAVARADDGRVVFVTDAIAHETVVARLHDEHDRFAKAHAVEVLTPSPARVEPACPHVARGCGGCGWQHIAVDAQQEFKRSIVVDALERIGKLRDPDVRVGEALAPWAFRSTVRVVIDRGRPGFRRARSHDPVMVDSCIVAHPRLAELLTEADFGSSREATLRIGSATGERMVILSPTAKGASFPADVIVIGEDEIAAGRHEAIHDEVAGRRWRVSAGSFFQTRADGAGQLVTEVVAACDALHGDAAAAIGHGASTIVDLCCGVGLLGGALLDHLRAGGDRGYRLLGVERSRSSVADAQHNLADLPQVKIVRASIESWRPSPADLVLADPARAGLRKVGVARVVATGAGGVVLVSCDPGSLGRDASLLASAGYRLERATLVDMFPHTPHIEVVSAFRLAG